MIEDKRMIFRIFNLMLDCDMPAKCHTMGGDFCAELFYMLQEHIEVFHPEELE